MKLTCGLSLTLPLLLVLLMVVATKGHTVLQCYVCDNCEKVNKKLTPLEQCGGENFSTTTTTTTSTPMSSTESKSTSSSTPPTTTLIPSTVSTSTASPSTEDPSTLNTTIELITLPTSTFAPSTTPLITFNSTQLNASSSIRPSSIYVTPNTETSTVTATDFVIPSSESSNFYESSSSLSNFSDAGLNRQRRHTEFNGITYYCYKIQKKYDNVFGTKRGCIGVKTNERPVCDELDMANNNQTKKCSACTKTMCNGSSAMGASIATLLVALLALIYKH